MERLWETGVSIQAYDPLAMNNIRQIYADTAQLTLCDSAEAALENADALVIVTEWNEFQKPNFRLIKERLHYPVIFDGRNLFKSSDLQQLGFDYFAIGQGKDIFSSQFAKVNE